MVLVGLQLLFEPFDFLFPFVGECLFVFELFLGVGDALPQVGVGFGQFIQFGRQVLHRLEFLFGFDEFLALLFDPVVFVFEQPVGPFHLVPQVPVPLLLGGEELFFPLEFALEVIEFVVEFLDDAVVFVDFALVEF